jgi:hypothetical protein
VPKSQDVLARAGLLAVPLFATLKIVADHLKGLVPVAAFLGK